MRPELELPSPSISQAATQSLGSFIVPFPGPSFSEESLHEGLSSLPPRCALSPPQACSAPRAAVGSHPALGFCSEPGQPRLYHLPSGRVGGAAGDVGSHRHHADADPPRLWLRSDLFPRRQQGRRLRHDHCHCRCLRRPEHRQRPATVRRQVQHTQSDLYQGRSEWRHQLSCCRFRVGQRDRSRRGVVPRHCPGRQNPPSRGKR